MSLTTPLGRYPLGGSPLGRRALGARPAAAGGGGSAVDFWPDITAQILEKWTNAVMLDENAWSGITPDKVGVGAAPNDPYRLFVAYSSGTAVNLQEIDRSGDTLSEGTDNTGMTVSGSGHFCQVAMLTDDIGVVFTQETGTSEPGNDYMGFDFDGGFSTVTTGLSQSNGQCAMMGLGDGHIGMMNLEDGTGDAKGSYGRIYSFDGSAFSLVDEFSDSNVSAAAHTGPTSLSSTFRFSKGYLIPQLDGRDAGVMVSETRWHLGDYDLLMFQQWGFLLDLDEAGGKTAGSAWGAFNGTTYPTAPVNGWHRCRDAWVGVNGSIAYALPVTEMGGVILGDFTDATLSVGSARSVIAIPNSNLFAVLETTGDNIKIIQYDPDAVSLSVINTIALTNTGYTQADMCMTADGDIFWATDAAYGVIG